MRFVRKYGSIIFLLIRIAIIVAVPFLVADSLSSHTLKSTQYVKYYDGVLYGLDKGENSDCLFKYDLKIASGRFTDTHDIADMTVSGEGEIYLLQTKNGSSKLLRWKKNGFTDFILNTPEVDGMTPQRILASNKGIFYIYYSDEAGEEFARIGYNEDWKTVGGQAHFDGGGYSLNTAEITENGDIYLVTDNGSVYRAQKDGDPLLIFDVANGPEDNTAYTNYRFTPYYFSFTDIKSGNNYSISLVGEDFSSKSIKRTYKAAKTFDDLKLRNANYTGDDIKAGCLNFEDGSKGAAVCGEVEATVRVIEWTTLWYIIVLLAVAGAIALLFWLFRKKLERLEDRMLGNDVSILITVTVIAMIVCLLVSNLVLVSYLKVHQISQSRETCTELAGQIVNELKEQDVEALIETGETPLIDKYADQGVLVTFYTMRDGEIYYASESKNREVPADKSDPGLGENVKKAAETAIEKETITHCVSQINGIRHATVAVPMGNLFNEASVLFVSHPIQEFWQEFLSEIIWILALNLVTWLAVIAVVIRVLKRLEKQLQGLLDASARVLAGELGAQADDRGKNEVAVAIRAFNRLSRKLKLEEKAVENREIITKSFTPIGLMRQINGSFKDTVVKVGSEVQGQAQVLCILLECEKQSDNTLQSEEGFKTIEKFIAALSELGGSIMDISGLSLRYVDADMTRDLFRVTAPIIRKINMGGGIKVCAALNIADVKAKVIGTDEYMILDVCETNDRGGKELLCEASQKGIAFIVTELAAKIAGLKKYHFRRVGIFSANESGRGSVLYEALDASVQEEAMKRLCTKETFEKGLGYYYVGDMSRARRQMAKVLIEDNSDTVARFFLKACESFNDSSEAPIPLANKEDAKATEKDAEVIENAAEETVEDAAVTEKAVEVAEKAAEVIENAEEETVEDAAVTEKAAEAAEKVAEVIENAAEETVEDAEVTEKAAEATESVTEVIENIAETTENNSEAAENNAEAVDKAMCAETTETNKKCKSKQRRLHGKQSGSKDNKERADDKANDRKKHRGKSKKTEGTDR